MGLTDAPNDQIMRAMKFTIKDLDSNRDGLLTRAQHNRVRQWQLGWSAAVAFIMLIILSMMVILTRSILPTQFWLLIVIMPVSSALFWFQQRTLRIVTRGKVASSHGRVRVIQDLHSYIIEIQSKRFRLKSDGASAFVTGETYTLYYLPGLDYLLSAEHHAQSASNTGKGQRHRAMQKRTEPVERTQEQRLKWHGKRAIEVREDRHIRRISKATRPAPVVRDVRPRLKQRAKEYRGR